MPTWQIAHCDWKGFRSVESNPQWTELPKGSRVNYLENTLRASLGRAMA